jgi:hypothetical protein
MNNLYLHIQSLKFLYYISLIEYQFNLQMQQLLLIKNQTLKLEIHIKFHLKKKIKMHCLQNYFIMKLKSKENQDRNIEMNLPLNYKPKIKKKVE